MDEAQETQKEETRLKAPKRERPPETKNEPKPEAIIYLGPSMMERDEGGQTTFRINYAATFNNGIPPDVVARQKSDNDFARFFFQVSKAAKAMRDIATPDNALAQARKRVHRAYQDRMKKRVQQARQERGGR